MKCLKNSYGVKDDPRVVRRNLSFIKQVVTESLEDFADRVQHAAAVRYKGAGDKVIEKWAAELFLKGAKENYQPARGSQGQSEKPCFDSDSELSTPLSTAVS